MRCVMPTPAPSKWNFPTERAASCCTCDDGVGITHENAGHGHWGLQGMRERAQRLGAELQLWTRPGWVPKSRWQFRPGGCISAADRVGIGPE